MDDYSDLTDYQYNDINARFNELRQLVYDNSEFIYIDEDANRQITIKGIRGAKHFRFNIRDLIERSSKIDYEVTFAPRSTRSNGVYTKRVESLNIIPVFKSWLILMRKHLTRVGLHPTDKFDEQHKNEFQESYFKLLDEDADTNVFDVKRQILIDSIIEQSILELKEAGVSEDDPLIVEAIDLKSNLNKLTKNQVFEKIKSLYPILIKHGVPILKRITKVCTETMISSGYNLVVKTIAESIV